MNKLYYIIVCFKLNVGSHTADQISAILDIFPCHIFKKNINEFVIAEMRDNINGEEQASQILNALCKTINENFDAKIYEKDILPAHDNIPNKLYLYRSWSNCPIKNMEIIKNHKFYLSDPKYFNDPFDCQMQIYPYTNDKDNLKNNIGIRCFSSTYNNILMWSHYADEHKGFCIEFDASLLTARSLGEIIKVRYVNKMPTYLGINSIDIKRFLCYKYKDWAYEKEYRLICLKKETPQFEFPMNAITKVYFGCRMDENAKKFVRSFVSESNKINDTGIKIIGLRADEDEFALKEYRDD